MLLLCTEVQSPVNLLCLCDGYGVLMTSALQQHQSQNRSSYSHQRNQPGEANQIEFRTQWSGLSVLLVANCTKEAQLRTTNWLDREYSDLFSWCFRLMSDPALEVEVDGTLVEAG